MLSYYVANIYHYDIATGKKRSWKNGLRTNCEYIWFSVLFWFMFKFFHFSFCACVDVFSAISFGSYSFGVLKKLGMIFPENPKYVHSKKQLLTSTLGPLKAIFLVLYKTVLTFDSVSEISKCYRHWCESCHLNSRWWILSSISPEEINVMSKIHEIPLLLYFLFIYLFVLHFPACKCKNGQRAKILLYRPSFKAMFALYRIAFAHARKPYRIWLLFTKERWFRRDFCNEAKLCRVDL